jgi:hypothetical protein
MCRRRYRRGTPWLDSIRERWISDISPAHLESVRAVAVGPRSQPLPGAEVRARTTRQWRPDREARTAHQRERSERLQGRERAGSASVADTVGAMRGFARGPPGRLHSGSATVSGRKFPLVLLQKLRHFTRDSSLGSSGKLEDSCCLGKSRPLATQMHAAAGHVVTILIGPAGCQAYPARYSPESSETVRVTPPGSTSSPARSPAAPACCGPRTRSRRGR